MTENEPGEPVRVITYDNGLDEAEGIALRIKEAVTATQFAYRDHAVFMRINALTRSLESAFVKHGIPFQIVKGLAFFERKENKDVLAYLRLLANPNDSISFLRVVNEPARGIGKVSLDRLQAFASDKEISLLDAAGQVAQITGHPRQGGHRTPRLPPHHHRTPLAARPAAPRTGRARPGKVGLRSDAAALGR